MILRSPPNVLNMARLEVLAPLLFAALDPLPLPLPLLLLLLLLLLLSLVRHPSPKNTSSLSILTNLFDSASVNGRTLTATEIDDCFAVGTDVDVTVAGDPKLFG